ncbi:hypothetical protein BJY21_001091 [Kineosphaera limosa]|uniref:Nitroreductase domain-containing protein n=1 Tax=Kineosphaera limosa NBRC 100340 TaxID=1184609 RepID=K6WTW8_9MICO|nr:hypothetical protein [Kineosphaera limosa]NYD99906.1 hypothetical protein [Kineosphaera limosa]GAB95557.1 hypothetical protein KILIM_022_00420 [Kineosphaera limosa NBRC 100340]
MTAASTDATDDAGWIGDLRASQELWSRAPSAHNTQPWRLRVDGEQVELGWDPARTLPVTDATGRDLRLSLGAFAEAIRLVLADPLHGGHDLALAWSWDEPGQVAGLLRREPDGGPSGDVSGRGRPDAAEVPGNVVSTSPAVGEFAPSAAEVAARRTHRGDYVAGPDGIDAVAALAAGLTEAGRRLGVGLLAVDPALATDLVRVADREQFEDPAAAAELTRWLRWRSSSRRLRTDDGLGHEALLLPAWQVAALARVLRPRLHPAARRMRVLRTLARFASAARPGALLVLHAPAHLSPERECALGADLLRLWLLAGRHGWSVHPWSQLLDVPDTQAVLTRAVPPGQRPYAVFRVGIARGLAPPSPRRTDIWG